MLKIMVEKVEFKQCEKCGVHKKPDSFQVRKQKRKSCNKCRTKK